MPQEFSFGKRDSHIRALRKPVLQRVELSDASGTEDDGPSSYDDDARAGYKQFLQRGQANEAAEPATARSARAATTPRQHQKQHDEHEELVELRARVKSQDMELARLHGNLAATKRELEAAKNKLRQLALSGVPVTTGNGL